MDASKARCGIQRLVKASLSTGLLAGLQLIGPGQAFADVVITNTPNNTNGGSNLVSDDNSVSAPKSLIFTTGDIPSSINSLILGINPTSIATPLPLTTSFNVSVWSTTNNGLNSLPVSPLTTYQQLYATINATKQLYAFDPEALGSLSLFTLEPETTYGLTLSGITDIVLASQPKWGNTGNTEAGGTEPEGLNGFTYQSFAISANGGLTWCTARPTNIDNACGQPYNAVALDVYFLGVTPGTSTNANNPSSPLLTGGTVIVNEPGTYSTDYILSKLGGTIDINGKTSTFTGVFSGRGPLRFSNSSHGGQTTLSGISSYTGTTTVEQGAKLIVNGSIASSSELTVWTGGTVGGSGQLPSTRINPDGVVSPGNSIGILTISGNYNLNNGLAAIEMQGPQNDQIVVAGGVGLFTGTATLIPYRGGTMWPSMPYTIITANTSAPFATAHSLTLDQSLVAPSSVLQLGTTLIQEADGDPTTFDVEWRPNNGTGAVRSALQALGTDNDNSNAAAGVFDSAFSRLATSAAGNANATGAAIGSTGFTADQASAAGLSSDFVIRLADLLAITSGSQLQKAINSITPESYAAFQSVGINSLRIQRETLSAQAGSCVETGWVINNIGKHNETPSGTPGETIKMPLCVFATGGNTTSTIRGSDGLSGYDSAIAGGFYGVEVQPSKQWTVGVAYGYGTATLSNLGAGNNSVSSTVNSGTLYGVYEPDVAWTVKGLLGYGNYNLDGIRHLIAVGNGNAITGHTTANGYTAGLQVDHVIPLSQASAKVSVMIKPLLGLAYGAYQQSGFRESGDPAMNLTVADHTSQSLVGTVGAEVVAAIPLNPLRSQLLKPRLRVAYQVDALANTTGNNSLSAALPAAGVSFTSTGENRGPNALSISGTLEYVMAQKASLYASAAYEAFSTGSQFAYGGGLKLSF
jgi:uncharacterized protein YhjY with autotransporter beta-barrel domain